MRKTIFLYYKYVLANKIELLKKFNQMKDVV